MLFDVLANVLYREKITCDLLWKEIISLILKYLEMSNDHPSSSRYIYNIETSHNHNESGNQTITNNYSMLQPSTRSELEQSQALFPPQHIVGKPFDENVERVFKWLQDPVSDYIGVWSMESVGKTTLLTCICNRLKEDYTTAGSVYWVDVSQLCSPLELQDKRAKEIGIGLIV